MDKGFGHTKSDSANKQLGAYASAHFNAPADDPDYPLNASTGFLKVFGSRPQGALAYLASMWERRLVCVLLAKRDVEVRFQQTAVGVAWLVLKPALMALMMFIVFGKLAGFSDGKDPADYAVALFCGVIPWQYFAMTLPEMAASLPNNRILITHTYFPRGLIPVATAAGLLADFAVGLAILISGALIVSGFSVDLLLRFPLLLAVVAGLVGLTLGAGLLLSVANAYYRDVQNLLPFLLQLGFFATPVAYSTSTIPEQWRWVSWLNPLTGLIEGFRAALVPSTAIQWGPVLGALVAAMTFLIAGVAVAARFDRKMADDI